ncbi:Retrovirus-related Pol polyprotein from transposon TNT 1-94 [Sesamum angolense]|uniref:Retrovirus-related Pol polyprotein from transposon TNT 1-94 n=1 Tax=Sesamum angolense TaxID=2727404 RepID=A0AAE1T4Z3_9LAMI|nr:Retrovirus-related Pol polyprotein from transposon TNT 1-94 [Sesamum angolense]
MNQTLLNKVRCLLISSGLAKSFWGEALLTAAYLINRSPSVPLVGKVPEHVWSGKNVDLSSLRVFGCSAFVFQNNDKLEPRAQKCVFIGYPEGVKGYRLWLRNQTGFKVVISKDVTFNESEMPCLNTSKTELDFPSMFNKVEGSKENNQQGEEDSEATQQESENTRIETQNDSSSENIPSTHDYQLARDRDRRESRIILALTAQFDWKLKQMDVKTAFLHGDLDEQIYMCQPSGFIDKEKPNHKNLCKTFEMKDLGNAKRILGMTIDRNRKTSTIFLNQSFYVTSVLEKFSMKNAKATAVPLAAHFQLCKEQSPKNESETEQMKNIPYSNAIGSVMYLMVSTRPDIAYAVSCLSRYMSNAGLPHWEALWLLRYLNGSVSAGIKFSKHTDGVSLVGYVDSNYANDRDSRRSTTSTKHIDVRYHFIRDIVGKEIINLEKINSDNNPADMVYVIFCRFYCFGPRSRLAMMKLTSGHFWIWSKVEHVEILAQILTGPEAQFTGWRTLRLKPTGLPTPPTDPLPVALEQPNSLCGCLCGVCLCGSVWESCNRELGFAGLFACVALGSVKSGTGYLSLLLHLDPNL